MDINFRTFRIIFGVGLALAGTAIFLVLATRVTPVVSAAYLLLAVLHIGLLVAIAWGMDRNDRTAAPAWLYTAGFLHTLIALGVAIATAGRLLSQADPGQMVDALGTILLPMGAAVLPHALGVVAGQLLERPGSDGSGQAYEVIIERLTQQAEQGYRSLDILFTRREALLRQEIAALERQVDQWQRSEHALGALVAQVNALSIEIGRVAQSAGGLRGNVDAAATHARALAPALQDTVQVVDDLRKLQESIVDLLQQPIFHRR